MLRGRLTFRRFCNGIVQYVEATSLTRLGYPPLPHLAGMGGWQIARELTSVLSLDFLMLMQYAKFFAESTFS